MNQNDQNFLVQKIRTQYTEKEHTQLDDLKALDRKVKRPANIFAYSFGTLAALVMGSGMSLVMTDISEKLGLANSMPLGLAVGIAGMVMAIATYPIYKKVLNSRRRRYAAQVIALSDRLMKD